MNLHWGKTGLAQLRFSLGSISHRGADDQRIIHRRWLQHRIRSAFGLSFGHKSFVGLMLLADTREERERIK